MSKIGRLSLYVFKTSDNLFLADIKSSANKENVIGAIVPSDDGNYYDHIIIAPQRSSAANWLNWLDDAVKQSWVKISEEFSFDVSNVKVIELQEV